MVNSAEHYKDSCGYGMGVSKQFLAYASGGLAFVVASAMVPGARVGGSTFWSFALFILSLVAGLVFAMSVVGHINKSQNYDVYTARLRSVAFLQVASFFVGVVVLGLIVLAQVRGNSAQSKPAPTILNVKTGTHEVHYDVPPGAKIEVVIKENGLADVTIAPASAKPGT